MEHKSEQELKRAQRLGGLVYTFANVVNRTVRLRVEGWEPIESRIRQGIGAVIVSWHGRSFLAAHFMRNRGFYVLVSWSRDGEIQANIFRRFGFNILRGSTGRGGVRAALEAARTVKSGGVLAFTPDGPRGPSQKVQPGALLIAQKAGCPIYPAGLSAYPRKMLPTWDRYLIPFPFARGIMLFGEPMMIPPDVSKEEYSVIAEELEQKINALEERAEMMARGRQP